MIFLELLKGNKEENGIMDTVNIKEIGLYSLISIILEKCIMAINIIIQ
jgi:hypothetical protein